MSDDWKDAYEGQKLTDVLKDMLGKFKEKMSSIEEKDNKGEEMENIDE